MKDRATYIKRAAYLAFAILVFGLVWKQLKVAERNTEVIQIELDVRNLTTDSVQLFYDIEEIGYFEENSQWAGMTPDLGIQTLRFELEVEDTLFSFRVDPGTGIGISEFSALRLKAGYQTWEMDAIAMDSIFEFNEDCKTNLDTNNVLSVERLGKDAYFSSKVDLGPTTADMLRSTRAVFWPFATALLAAIICFLLLNWLNPIELVVPALKGLQQTARTLFTAKGLVALGIAGVVYCLAYAGFQQVHFHEAPLKLILTGTFQKSDDVQVYFAGLDRKWSQYSLSSTHLYGSPSPQLVEFDLPDTLALQFLRLDFGSNQHSVQLDSLTLHTASAQHTWSAEEISKMFAPNEHIVKRQMRQGRYVLDIEGNDAYLMSIYELGRQQQKVLEKALSSTIPIYLAVILSLLVLTYVVVMDPFESVAARAKTSDLVLAGSFCALLALPLLNSIVPIDRKIKVIENRIMKPKPKLRAATLLEFPKEYNEYFRDNFGLRKTLVRWNALVKGVGLGVSPKRDLVAFGKEGWMFFAQPNVIEHYVHRTLYTPAELERLTTKLENRQAWLKEQGADYYLTIAPLKATIYPELLPDKYVKLNEQSKLGQLTDHLKKHSTIKVVDLRPVLLKAKELEKVYYKGDTHWNVLGAYLAYRELAKAMAKDHPEIVPIPPECLFVLKRWEEGPDLANLIGLNDIFLKEKYELHPKVPYRAIQITAPPYKVNHFFQFEPGFDRNDSLTGPDLMVFRDSFSGYMRPFLSENFHRSTYLWTPLFHPEPVEREKPDIVVHELLERFIDQLFLDDPGEPRYPQ